MVAFDTTTLAVKHHMPLAPCQEPSGMAADLAHGRIFSGCDNKMIAVTDMKTGKVMAQIPIGEGVDANRFDPATGLVFSSNGESGTLTIAHETVRINSPCWRISPPVRVRAPWNWTPGPTLFTVTADLKPGVPTADRPHPRAVPVPGTFRLIVLTR